MSRTAYFKCTKDTVPIVHITKRCKHRVSDIKIITDPFGGYLRFYSISKDAYVTMDGRTRKNFKDKAEFYKHSHYYILKREEM